MNTNELKQYLQEADANDFQACLLENYQKDSPSYFKMLSEIYWNDKAHFAQLSAGCKAALMIYIFLK